MIAAELLSEPDQRPAVLVEAGFLWQIIVTHLECEQFMITRNGRPAVVMVSADEWESLQETLFWLSQPGIHESLAEAEADIDAGRVYDEAHVRRSLGIPARA